MGWRFTLWSILLGFSGGFAGLYVAADRWPGVHNAPGWGMVVGALAGAVLGCGVVALTHTRRSGD